MSYSEALEQQVRLAGKIAGPVARRIRTASYRPTEGMNALAMPHVKGPSEKPLKPPRAEVFSVVR